LHIENSVIFIARSKKKTLEKEKEFEMKEFQEKGIDSFLRPILILVFVCFVFLIFGVKPRYTKIKDIDIDSAREQIELIVAEEFKVCRNILEEFPQLYQLIQADVDVAIIYMLIAEAKYSSAIVPEEESIIVLKAQSGEIESAYRYLEWCVYKNITKQMNKNGHSVDTNSRRFWNNANPVASMLFLDVPLASRLGKKKEFFIQTIQWTNEEKWYEPQISQKEYENWKAVGGWPFKEEITPEYVIHN
jgi:hypothetical protein